MLSVFRLRYEEWCKNLANDKILNDELISIKGNDVEIVDRFSSLLQFGTAGARGLIGAGTNRINTVTVSHISEAYATFLKLNFQAPSLVVSYDTRKYSKEFAIASSEVFAAHGIKVHIFEEPKPIGVLSFAIRTLKCSGGIMITASHNPPEYNGYKIYDEHGAQPVDLSEVSKIRESKEVFDFKRKNFYDALADGIVLYVEPKIEDEYVYLVQKNTGIDSINNIDVTYSPLNGCASKTFCKLFSANSKFHIVEEQKNPDCEFSTCCRPDPQDSSAFSLALKLAENHGSDLIILNDPDGDRLGIAIKKINNYKILTGIEIAALFLNFMIELNNDEIQDFYIIKSIVSGGLCDSIVKFYNLNCIQTLPGFKYISQKVHELEQKKCINLRILGFEESNGFLLFPFVHDKDGISSSAFFCKMVSYYKKRNLNCCDTLNDLYKKFGYNMQKNISFREIDKDKVNGIIDKFKEYFLKNNLNATKINDYRNSETYYLKEKKFESGKIGKSNILEIIFENENKIFVRASGTEPLIKFYIMHNGKTEEESLCRCKKMENLVVEIYNSAYNSV